MSGIFGTRDKPTADDPVEMIQPKYGISFDALSSGRLIGNSAFRKSNAAEGRIKFDGANISFEVLPGDFTRDDAEKSELIGLLDQDGKEMYEATGKVYYGLKIRFAEDWIPPEGKLDGNFNHATFFQLKKTESNDKSTGPAFALMGLGYEFILKIHGGPVDNVNERIVSCGTFTPGEWIYLIFSIVFDKAAGSVYIYRKNEGQESFSSLRLLRNIPTILYDNNGVIPLECHIGIYRSPADFSNKLWFGGFLRGSTYDDVKNNLK